MAARVLLVLFLGVLGDLEGDSVSSWRARGGVCEGACEANIMSNSDDSALNMLQLSARSMHGAKPQMHNGQRLTAVTATAGRTARGTQYTVSSYAYGKYFGVPGGKWGAEPNLLYVFSPNVGDTFIHSAPMVLHFHGGGFIAGNAITEASDSKREPFSAGFEIEAYLDKGIVFVSAAYRLVGETHYYKGSDGITMEEEFIHVSEEGALSLDSRRLLSQYKVVTGWQELMTKCVYDGARALDFLVDHAAEIGFDPQRIGLCGDSAATAVTFYLATVYPRLKDAPPYRAVSVTLRGAQLDYPFLPLMHHGWKFWMDDLGENALLSTVCSKEACTELMGQGGQWCPRPQDCNLTWFEEAGKRFCGDNFATTKLRDVADWYTWPLNTAFNRGIRKLWYTSSNLAGLERSQSEGPLFVYIANDAQTLDLAGVTHSAFWARTYARVLEKKSKKDVMFLMGYKDYPGMSEADKGTSRYGFWNYRSNFDWRSELEVAVDPRGEIALRREMLLFHCRAMGLQC